MVSKASSMNDRCATVVSFAILGALLLASVAPHKKQQVKEVSSYTFNQATVVEQDGKQYLVGNNHSVLLKPDQYLAPGSTWGAVVVQQGVVTSKVLLEGAGGTICQHNARMVYDQLYYRGSETGTYKVVRC